MTTWASVSSTKRVRASIVSYRSVPVASCYSDQPILSMPHPPLGRTSSAHVQAFASCCNGLHAAQSTKLPRAATMSRAVTLAYLEHTVVVIDMCGFVIRIAPPTCFLLCRFWELAY